MPSFDNLTHSLTTKALHRRLSRRASLKLNRTPSAHRRIHIQPLPRLPTEILDRIIEFALEASHCFDPIASFALASSDFRLIAFRRFFRILRADSSSKWTLLFSLLSNMSNFADSSGENAHLWVRHIVTIPAVTLKVLNPFHNLRSLSINFEYEGLATQHTYIKLLLNPSAPDRLESLTLSSLPRIDIPLLKIISARFPHLRALRLSCTERLHRSCCWVCFEESASGVVHSPVPDMFATPGDLALAFAQALRPLIHLTYIHFGIFLSKETALIRHMNHDENDDEPEAYGPEECPTCQEDDDFYDLVRAKERAASIILARHLRMLRSVGWSSFFPLEVMLGTSNVEEQEGIDVHRATTVYILRQDGRIKARSKPWE